MQFYHSHLIPRVKQLQERFPPSSPLSHCCKKLINFFTHKERPYVEDSNEHGQKLPEFIFAFDHFWYDTQGAPLSPLNGGPRAGLEKMGDGRF